MLSAISDAVAGPTGRPISLDQQEKKEWNAFVTSYCRGDWDGDAQRPGKGGKGGLPMPGAIREILRAAALDDYPPASPRGSVSRNGGGEAGHGTEHQPNEADRPRERDADVPVSSDPIGITPNPSPAMPQTSSQLLSYYAEHRYLPAFPLGLDPAPLEARLRTITRLKLLTPSRRAAIQRLVRIGKAYFNREDDTIVASVIDGSKQIVLAEEGPLLRGNGAKVREPGGSEGSDLRVLDASICFCPHSMLHALSPDVEASRSTVTIRDATSDWRFKENPLVKAGAGFYAGQALYVSDTTSSSGGVSRKQPISIGALCVLSSKDRPFSDADQTIIEDLAAMLSREFEQLWEVERREREGEWREWMRGFIQLSTLAASPPPTPSARGRPAAALELVKKASEAVFEEAARGIRGMLQAASVTVLSMRDPCPVEALEPQRRKSVRTAPQSRIISEASSPTVPPHWVDPFGKGPPSPSAAAGSSFLFPTYPAPEVLSLNGSEAWSDRLVSEGGGALRQSMATCISAGRAVCNRLTGATALERYLPEETTAYVAMAIPDHDGSASLLVLVTADRPYAEFEQADEELISLVGAICSSAVLKRRVVEADAAKLSFVSRVSHELRTPLHGIMSQLELIRMSLSADFLKPIEGHLQTAEVCGETLAMLLDDVLEIGKARLKVRARRATESDRGAAGAAADPQSLATSRSQPLRRVDLKELVREVAHLSWSRRMRMAAVEQGDGAAADKVSHLECLVEVEGRRSGWNATVDAAGLKRILLNLTGNALKFTERGHVKLIMRGLRRPPPADQPGLCWIEFSVEDTGKGMSQEFINDQLFVPFRQYDSFAPGAGLGMSICDSLISRMDGNISVSSQLGQGTQVRVSLPIRLEGAPAARPGLQAAERYNISSGDAFALSAGAHGSPIGPPAVPAGPVASEPPDDRADAAREPGPVASEPPPAVASGAAPAAAGAPLKVLVADDNKISLKILTAMLAKKGIKHYDQAMDGAEAVEKFKAFGPGLVLIDYEMPRMNGTEAAREMRTFEEAEGLYPCRIVVISGLSDDKHIQEAHEAGVNEWLVKGASLRQLADKFMLQ